MGDRVKKMDEAEVTKRVRPEMKRIAEHKARDRARAARWDLDVAAFFFAILVIVVILMYQGIGVEVVAPVAAAGLAMGWLMGWKKGKQKYEHFYDEELLQLELEFKYVSPEEQVLKELHKT